jgi:hypothetical protein
MSFIPVTAVSRSGNRRTKYGVIIHGKVQRQMREI